MFTVRTHAGSVVPSSSRTHAEAVARELLAPGPEEALCWVGQRLIVTNTLGHMTDRWAAVEAA